MPLLKPRALTTSTANGEPVRRRDRWDVVTLGLILVLAAMVYAAVGAFIGTGAVAEHTEHVREIDVELVNHVMVLHRLDLETEIDVEGFVDATPENRAGRLTPIVGLMGQAADLRQVVGAMSEGADADLAAAVQRTGERVDRARSEVLRLAGEGNAQAEQALEGGELEAATDAYRFQLDNLQIHLVGEMHTQFDLVLAETRAQRITVSSVLALVALLLGVVGRIHRRQLHHAAAQQEERSAFSEQQVLQSRMHSAFEMALTEDAALATTGRALREELPDWRAEVLLADSSAAHVQRATCTHPDAEEPSCAVTTPMDCPAIRRGSSLVFDDPTAYDTCPQLRGRDLEGGAALCTPLKVMGKSVGILHAIAPYTPSPHDIRRVNTITQTSGDRVGVLRAFETTRTQAERDSLTGLLNRRSLEKQVKDLALAGTSYSVAFCDLDHFKRINDTHGHAAGDRALRVFGETLSEAFRPTDLVGRWGGEEFVAVLLETDPEEAANALERVQATLAMTLLTGDAPRYTFSAGVSGELGSFEDTVARADEALLEAKRQGRNRVVGAGSTSQLADDETATSDDETARGDGETPVADAETAEVEPQIR